MAVVGYLGISQASGLFSERGSLGPTILQSESPMVALISVIVTIGVAAIIGGLVARMTTSVSGMFILGFSLFALSMRLHGVTEFIMSGSSVNLLIIESIVVGTIVYIGSIVVFSIGGSLQDVRQSKTPNSYLKDLVTTLLISLPVLLIVVLVAKSPMKGQVIGATLLGGITIGVLARQCMPSVQPVILFSMPIVIGGLGYFIATVIGPVSDIGLTQQALSPLLLPMPMEYAGGVVMGVAIGLGWAASLAETPEVVTVTAK